MKILASDFDGTFCQYNRVPDENIQAVKRWRAAGNRFGFVSGRDLRLMMSMVTKFQIPFDFLICGSGTTVYDKEKNLMAQSVFPGETVQRICREPLLRRSQHVLLSTSEDSWLVIQSCESPFDDGTPIFRPMTLAKAEELSGVNQISLAFLENEEAGSCAQTLNQKYGEWVCANLNGNCIDITPAGVNKFTALKEFLRINGWEASQLLAVGDGENDLVMIQGFHGYTVSEATETVRACAAKVYPSVAHLIEDHMCK